MCKTHFSTVTAKSVAMANGILWLKMGGKSCVANYFLSFSPILMKWMAQMFALGCRCARTFFDSGRKCVAMVTAYYGKWMAGKILRRELTSSVFHQFSWNVGTDVCPWGRRWMASTHSASTVTAKECCHGNGILWQKCGGKWMRRELLRLSFSR